MGNRGDLVTSAFGNRRLRGRGIYVSSGACTSWAVRNLAGSSLGSYHYCTTICKIYGIADSFTPMAAFILTYLIVWMLPIMVWDITIYHLPISSGCKY